MKARQRRNFYLEGGDDEKDTRDAGLHFLLDFQTFNACPVSNNTHTISNKKNLGITVTVHKIHPLPPHRILSHQ